MKLTDFNFELPEELIALRPVNPRPNSKLLVYQSGRINDGIFSLIQDYLRPGDRLVLNNTKVIPARLSGLRRRISDQGETFAKIEATLLSVNASGHWMALAKPAKRVRIGERIEFSNNFYAKVISKSENGIELAFNLEGAEFDKTIADIGSMPLPPYIASKRPADKQDIEDYQTVFAKELGAVAAPTASLHFDETLISTLKSQGIDFTQVTLHVGAGTFLPVKTDDIENHKMHSEWGLVSQQAAEEIQHTKQQGGRVIAVGTTSLRLIETACRATGQIAPWQGETDIFIKPGFNFLTTDGLITNFHLPKSTLLMLVSAFIGLDRAREIYEYAISEKYRFFSYGDGSILFP